MTSTSFNIGISDSKCSSKVLKPPGGGHTDIFGIHGDGQPISTPKRRNQPTSQINSCFIMEDKATTQKGMNINSDDNKPLFTEEKKDDVNKNGLPEETNEKKVIENGNRDVEKTVTDNGNNTQSQKRGRVPPGGYSSGFW